MIKSSTDWQMAPVYVYPEDVEETCKPVRIDAGGPGHDVLMNS